MESEQLKTGGPPEDEKREREEALRDEADRVEAEIDEAVEESFPASDPPAWTPSRAA